MLKIISDSIILLILFIACKKPEMVTATVPASPVDTISDTTVIPQPVINKTFLALGDSYTIGQSVAVNERYPVQTVAQLNNQNIKFDAPEIIAQTGWTTGSLLFRIDNTPPLRTTYDIVTLLIGVNNQYRGLPVDEFKTDFGFLLRKAIRFSGEHANRVMVLSIPDWGTTPFAAKKDGKKISEEIDSFNAVCEAAAQENKTHYINITEESRKVKKDSTLLANDHLHYSGKAYAVWAEKLASVIKQQAHK